jgi:hypothetical protein
MSLIDKRKLHSTKSIKYLKGVYSDNSIDGNFVKIQFCQQWPIDQAISLISKMLDLLCGELFSRLLFQHFEPKHFISVLFLRSSKNRSNNFQNLFPFFTHAI